MREICKKKKTYVFHYFKVKIENSEIKISKFNENVEKKDRVVHKPLEREREIQFNFLLNSKTRRTM